MSDQYAKRTREQILKFLKYDHNLEDYCANVDDRNFMEDVEKIPVKRIDYLRGLVK